MWYDNNWYFIIEYLSIFEVLLINSIVPNNIHNLLEFGKLCRKNSKFGKSTNLHITELKHRL